MRYSKSAMSPFLAHWLMCCASFAALVVARSEVWADQQGSELADVLEAGVEEWRHSIEFIGNYRYRRAMTSSKEDALEGRFGAVVGQPEDVTVGTIVKQGRNMRWSGLYQFAPVASMGAGEVSNVSFDSVTLGTLQANYFPRRGSQGGVVTISTVPDATDDSIYAGQARHKLLNPFVFNGGTDGKPLLRFAAKPGYDEQLESAVTKSDANHVSLRLERKGPKHSITTDVRFNTSYTPAVIDRISTRTVHGQHIIEGITVASDFVICKGGAIARQLRQAQGPVAPVGSQTKEWIASEWKSVDLGSRPPTGEDFVIEVPPGVKVNGLKRPPKGDIAYDIDLRTITENDLYAGPLDPGIAEISDDSDPRWVARIAWAAATIAVISLILFFVFRWRL